MKKITVIAAASLIALGSTVWAAPQIAEQAPAPRHFKKHNQNNLPRDLQKLNLSSKQKEQIQKIFEANRPTEHPEAAQNPNREQMQQKFEAARAAEQKLISSRNFDEAAARRLIEERQNEMQQHFAERQKREAEMQVQHLKTRHAIFQVLDSKQQKQWLENRSKHQYGKPNMPHRDHKKAEK